MPNMKKHLTARRSGMLNLMYSFFFGGVSYVLLLSFYYGLLLSLAIVSLASANVLNVGWRNAFTICYMKIRNAGLFGDLNLLLTTTIKYVSAFFLSIAAFHLTAILFGAYLFESFWSTLYFSCFMTILVAYPLSLYCWLTDGSVANLLNIFMESKYDSSIEGCLNVIVTCSIMGAWFGAFPIPLDWDRDWQEWPTTCCIGAAMGNAAAYAYMGMLAIWNSCKEKRRLPWSLFV